MTTLYATTGDGVLTGLQIAAQVAGTGRTLQDLARAMTKLPQLMINVKGVDKSRAATDDCLGVCAPTTASSNGSISIFRF